MTSTRQMKFAEEIRKHAGNFIAQEANRQSMITPTRVGIVVFALAVLLGPLYTVDEYSTVTNLISELGAQHTPNNFYYDLCLSRSWSGDSIRWSEKVSSSITTIHSVWISNGYCWNISS